MPGRTTLTRFLIDERRHHPDASGELNALLLDVALACRAIGQPRRPRCAARRCSRRRATPTSSGETQQHARRRRRRPVRALHRVGRSGRRDGLRGVRAPVRIPTSRGKYLLAFDPLDGSSNIDVNVSVGSIFSVLRCPAPRRRPASPATSCRPGPGRCAPATRSTARRRMLVLTVGTGVHGFTLDPELGEFILHRTPTIRIPATARGVRDQRLQPALLGAARCGATSTSAWPAAPARAARTSTCGGSPRWWPRRTASSPAAASSSTRATPRTRPGRVGCGCSTRPTRSPSSSSRPVGGRAPAAPAGARRRARGHCTSGSRSSSVRATRSSASSAITATTTRRELRRAAVQPAAGCSAQPS